MKVDEVLDRGFTAHAGVKARLKRIINGEEEATPQSVRADDKCIIGEWIYGPGADYAHHPEFAVLKRIHKEFHEAAYQALMLNQSGKKAEAADYVENGPFEQKSLEIKQALAKMKRAAAG